MSTQHKKALDLPQRVLTMAEHSICIITQHYRIPKVPSSYAVYLNGTCFLYANAGSSEDNKNTANIVARNLQKNFGGTIYRGKFRKTPCGADVKEGI